VIEGSRCPRCNFELEYNGNYWCTQEECDYTMPDVEGMTSDDKQAFNAAYTLLMRQTGREPDPQALFWNELY